MYLELDGAGPLYRQLTRALKGAVLDGRIAAGTRMPATRVLAQEIGLSRNTVRTAYDQLIAEGLFQGHAGSGSFVVEAPVAAPRAKAIAAIAPPSRYAKRMRAIQGLGVGGLHRGLRFNLQYGEPIHDPVAISAWRRELAEAAQNTAPDYPSAAGLTSLREAICEYLQRRRAIACTPADVLIVAGTQQAMALATQVLVDEGDTVLLEDPHYFSARYVFEAGGAKIVNVPTDGEGLVCSAIGNRSAKLAFVTPSHQFPGGSVMSMARRLELLNYSAQKKCWILEDDYDSEFRYDAHPLPALSALDSADRVIYAGSFSKVMFPSLRLGYMVVPAALRRDFILAKRLADLGSPAIEQVAMARYISSGGFERHLRRIVQIARRRRNALIEGLMRIGRGHFEVQDSRAGMHLVVWLPRLSYAQCDRLIALASEQSVGLHPIAPLYKKPPKVPGLLLGFAALSVPEIEAAMVVLGRCVDQLDSSLSKKR
jgi:GntR family transcriptional regulator/MocR family aminotransferase